MDRDPVVSVIVPVYNAERFLPEALGSVFAQSLPQADIEVIAVDDGSTDGSLAVLERLAGEHPSLRVLSIPNSGSAARPRNIGLDHARGRYVFFLDADDRLDPEALGAMTAMADETGVGVVLCRMASLGDRPVATTVFAETRRSADFIECGAYHTLGPWKLFRRAPIEEHGLRFSSGFRLGEDRPFVMAAYLLSPRIGVVADRVYYWLRARDDGGNATTAGQAPRAHLEANLALAEVIRDGTNPGERREILLARPVLGPGGFRVTFGKAFRTMAEDEQAEAIERARGFLEPLWTPGLRARGTSETQVLAELVLAGDRAALLRASETLAAGRPLPIVPRDGGFAYVDGGVAIGSLNARLLAVLDAVSVSRGTVRIGGSTAVDGVGVVPDRVTTDWVHRPSKASVPVVVRPRRGIEGETGTRVPFDAAVRVARLPRPGEWDVFVEARWGATVLRERFGRVRAAAVGTSDVPVRGNPSATVLFTPYGNLTVDVGTRRRFALVPRGPVRAARRLVRRVLRTP